MELPEFITYCALKDYIVLHERLYGEYHANVCQKQKLIVENDKFYATITYTHFAGQYNILYTSLAMVSSRADTQIPGVDFNKIISKFA